MQRSSKSPQAADMPASVSGGTPTEAHPSKRRRSGAPRNCAECRRLKLRCDKVFPCVSCVKRGLAAICPDGCLTTGQGNRFVLASTEELHEKIAILSHRIRTLEDALRDAYAKLDSGPHPLLTEELLSLKSPLQRDVPSGGTGSLHHQPTPDKQDSMVEALGSLSLRDKGSMNYFGQTASSWYLMQNEDTEDAHPRSPKSSIPNLTHPHFLESSGAFLLSLLPSSLGESSDDACKQILGSLPSASIAKHLRDVYYECAGWHYNPITVEQFNEDVLQYFYEREFSYSSRDYALFQRVAILFLVFAIGVAMDPGSESHMDVAEQYHQLGLAALFHGRPLERPTIHGVQALFLVFAYSYYTDTHDNCEEPSRWTLLGMVIRLGQAIGLHRDSTKFGLPDKEVQLRRTLLFELRYADSWQAVTLGRPPGMSESHVDNIAPVLGNPQSPEQANLSFKHRWTTECLAVLHNEAYGSKTPTHATVMRLDRTIRSFAMPIIYQKTPEGGQDGEEPPEYLNSITFLLQRASALAGREICETPASFEYFISSHQPSKAYMYLHRNFFAQALQDRPDDPASGPYGSSYLACYRGAIGGLTVVRELYATPAKHIMSNIWFWWAHLTSCSVVFASVISKCPSQSMAPSALKHLGDAVDLFAIVAGRFGAEKTLATISTLRDKAQRTLAAFRAGAGHAMPPRMPSADDEDDDELSALGGRTRVVSRRRAEADGAAAAAAALREMRALLGLDAAGMPMAMSEGSSSSSTSSHSQSPVPSSAGAHGYPAPVAPTAASVSPVDPWMAVPDYFGGYLYPSTGWTPGSSQISQSVPTPSIPPADPRLAQNRQGSWPGFGGN